MPETFDLDSAFETLATEVGQRTAAPGAAAAIGMAHRRRTTLAAAAAVAVIAVAGVVTSQLTGGGDKLSPAGTLPLPSPAPLDGTALDGASHGWVTGWHVATRADGPELAAFDSALPCINGAPDPMDNATPARFGNELYVGGGPQLGIVLFADFGGRATEAASFSDGISQLLARCAGSPATVSTYGDQAGVSYFDVPGTAPDVSSSTSTGPVTDGEAWVARTDDRFAMLLVYGAQTPPGDDAITDVGTALLAAVQDDASYHMSGALSVGSFESSSAYDTASSDGSTPTTATPPHGDISEQQLAAAYPGWSGPALPDTSAFHELPCLGQPQGSRSGTAHTIGTSAELAFHEFATAQDAASGELDLLTRLRQCDRAPWTVDTTTVPDVAVASYPGGVAWIAQRGTTVGVLTLAGATDPPQSVAANVGQLLLGTLS